MELIKLFGFIVVFLGLIFPVLLWAWGAIKCLDDAADATIKATKKVKQKKGDRIIFLALEHSFGVEVSYATSSKSNSSQYTSSHHAKRA